MKNFFFFLFLALPVFVSAQMDLSNGLIGHYPFSGNANDASSSLNHGTVVGAFLTSNRFGEENQAYSFDGINDYITISPDYLENNEFSFSAWIHPRNFSEIGTVISIGGTTGGDQTIYTHPVSGITGNSYNSNISAAAVWTEPVPSANVWYHVVLTRDQSYVKLYVDGTLIESVSVEGHDAHYGNAPSNAFIGARVNSTQFFNGLLDDVRIYNRAINTSEISVLASDCYGMAQTDLGLIGDYSFTGNANDESPFFNHGTVVGATLTANRFGEADQAYLLDGVNDYISLPSSVLRNNEFSFSVWIKPISLSEVAALVSMGSETGVDQALYIHNVTGVTGTSYSFNSTVKASNVSSGYFPVVNKWCHVALTRSESVLNLYINGKLAGSTLVNDPSSYGSLPTFAYLGARVNSTQFFNGVLDDVKIYNRALCLEDVVKLYGNYHFDCNVSPDLDIGLIGNYSFTGSADDASPTINHGIVHGASLVTNRLGESEQAYSFDGIDDYISLSSAPLQNDEVTFSAWIYPSSFSSVGTVLSIGGATGGDHALYVHPLSGITGTTYNTNGTANNVALGSVSSVNSWYHVVLTRGREDMKLYINGVLINTVAVSGSDIHYGNSPVFAYIGARVNSTQFFKGVIDDVRIYNRILCQAEIESLAGDITGMKTSKDLSGSARLAPNPSNGIIDIIVDTPIHEVDVSVVNSSGVIVYSQKFAYWEGRQLLNLNNIEKGLYLLTIQSKDGRLNKKIIIQ